MNPRFVDCHTHILPGMDDGSKSPEESVAMLREEARQGIRHVVLTPHFYASQNSPQEFLKRRQAAWNRLYPHLTADLPRLSLGAEVQYFEGICHVEDLSCLCLGGSTYLLLEMPFQNWCTRYVDDALALQSRPDLQIILAHIERYQKFAKPWMWEALREYGALTQSNADFFINKKTRRKAMHMYRRGEIDLLASDCHNLTTRPPNLAEAHSQINTYLT